MDEHKYPAQVKRARKLAEVFNRLPDVDAETLSYMDEDGWLLASAIAGINPPSPETKTLTMLLVGQGHVE